jgi:hypothetical protein
MPLIIAIRAASPVHVDILAAAFTFFLQGAPALGAIYKILPNSMTTDVAFCVFIYYRISLFLWGI